MFKKLLNSKGYSFVEVLVAAGVLGIVSLGVVQMSKESSSQNRTMSQNFEMDTYMRNLRTKLSKKVTCETMISGPSSINLAGAGFDVQEGLTIDSVKMIPPSITGSGVENVPVSIYVTFNRNLGTANTKPVRKTLALLQYESGTFVGCADYEDEAQKSAYKITCQILGGKFVDGVNGNYTCDYSAMTGNEVFIQNLKKDMCENVFGGAYDGNYCSAIHTASLGTRQGFLRASNITESFIKLNGNSRTTFKQLNCNAQNTYVRKINSSGVVECVTVGFCTQGIDCDISPPSPDCSCADKIPKGQYCSDGAGGTCEGKLDVNCSPSITYALSGNNSSAGDVKTCRETTYKSTLPGVCEPDQINETIAGTCKKFTTNTCNGTTAPGAIVNFPDGTSCGTDMECLGGVCQGEKCCETHPCDSGAGVEPVCSDGTSSFASKTSCEQGGDSCTEQSLTVWPSSGSTFDCVDTTAMPLCTDLRGSNCTAGQTISCTYAKDVRGSGMTLTCGDTVQRWCGGSAAKPSEFKCKDGSKGYSFETTCENANGGNNCHEEEKYVYSHPDRVNDPVDTRNHPLCMTIKGQECAKGSKKSCTNERRSKGEEEVYSCDSKQTIWCVDAGAKKIETCWNEIESKTDMSKTNSNGHPNEKYEPSKCLDKTCSIGETCTYDWKHGSKVYACEDKAKSKCSIPANPTAKNCDYRRPVVWDARRGQVLHQCLERAGAKTYTNHVLTDGRTLKIDAKYCTRDGSKNETGDGVGNCNGAYIEFKCDDGHFKVVEKECHVLSGGAF